ncbi:hypothetical protein BJF83_24335 [Nocardiopsis sp. CNR-923]|uniref:DUF4194 domain-containing protein n=1 Tax=Nocardiopsis sp. CNR-923 TaxID=1904965 RepID=UPI000966A003|nr:DUF4194 domain-containing protein [Nocardiopsis sp. CNR-923]OLT24318.1 hypothetical protein BJF83_24335 [Nocardiopsis sp. CNR-923]
MTDTWASDGTAPAEDTDLGYDADPFADEALSNSEDTEDRTSPAMFEEDTSTLYPEQRRCLHTLLKHRYISAERHPEQWAVLIANQDLIKSRLNDLFLELYVDRNYQVAFKRQATTETGDPLPSLLRDMSHSKEETIVMMYLRQRFFSQRQEGDNVVFVDRQAMLDEVADQRPEHATHRAMDHKRAMKAIDTLATAGVLLKTADPDRFRISPIIEVLLPVEKLRALWAWLMTQNGTDTLTPQARDAAHAELDFNSDVEEDTG